MLNLDLKKTVIENLKVSWFTWGPIRNSMWLQAPFVFDLSFFLTPANALYAYAKVKGPLKMTVCDNRNFKIRLCFPFQTTLAENIGHIDNTALALEANMLTFEDSYHQLYIKRWRLRYNFEMIKYEINRLISVRRVISKLYFKCICWISWYIAFYFGCLPLMANSQMTSLTSTVKVIESY